jgi:ABC-type multidrug transport system ATPase subunit
MATEAQGGMIEIRDLRVSYGPAEVLSGVSFAVRQGERLVLTGPNGVGKTTLLRALLGQVRYRGVARVGGYDVARQGVQARRAIGYVPQLPAFPRALTVEEVVEVFQKLRGLSPRPMSLLERVGLHGAGARPVGVLSGGMLRRLALAVALVGEPPVLLLDEPASNLDVEGEADLRRWFHEWGREGRTVVVASHRVAELRGCVDRVVSLRGGRVVADLPASAVRVGRRIVVTLRGAPEDVRAVARRIPAEATQVAHLDGVLRLLVPEDRLLPVSKALEGPEVGRCQVDVDVSDDEDPVDAGGGGRETTWSSPLSSRGG